MPPKKQPEKDQKDKYKRPGNLPAIPTPRSTRSAAPYPSSLDSTPTHTTPSRGRPPAARAALATFDMPPPAHFTRSHAYFADQAFGMSGVAMVRSGATVPPRTGTSLVFPPAAAKRVAEIAGGTASRGGWGPVNDFYRKRGKELLSEIPDLFERKRKIWEEWCENNKGDQQGDPDFDDGEDDEDDEDEGEEEEEQEEVQHKRKRGGGPSRGTRRDPFL